MVLEGLAIRAHVRADNPLFQDRPAARLCAEVPDGRGLLRGRLQADRVVAFRPDDVPLDRLPGALDLLPRA